MNVFAKMVFMLLKAVLLILLKCY